MDGFHPPELVKPWWVTIPSGGSGEELERVAVRTACATGTVWTSAVPPLGVNDRFLRCFWRDANWHFGVGDLGKSPQTHRSCGPRPMEGPARWPSGKCTRFEAVSGFRSLQSKGKVNWVHLGVDLGGWLVSHYDLSRKRKKIYIYIEGSNVKPRMSKNDICWKLSKLSITLASGWHRRIGWFSIQNELQALGLNVWPSQVSRFGKPDVINGPQRPYNTIQETVETDEIESILKWEVATIVDALKLSPLRRGISLMASWINQQSE